MATESAGRDRRIHQRHSCSWPATCLLRQSHKAPVVVIDASAGGFCILSKIEVETGETILLDLDAIGTFECQVRWVATDRFGVQIIDGAHELTTIEVDNLAQALGLASAPSPHR